MLLDDIEKDLISAFRRQVWIKYVSTKYYACESIIFAIDTSVLQKNHLRVKVGAYNGNPNYAYFKKWYYGIITLIFVYCSNITHFICKNCVYNKNHNP